VLAIAAALVPLPKSAVERWYSLGIYPHLQRVVTTVSGILPIALLDVVAIALLTALVWRLVRAYRRQGWRAAARAGAWFFAITASAVYLLFLLVWGFNYRRIPLEEKIVFDAQRIEPAHAGQFAQLSVGRVNDLVSRQRPPHGGEVPQRDEALRVAFLDVLRSLGHGTLPVTAAPKYSMLSWYFKRAGFDGMTNPLFLEVILNGDLLPFERPLVLAHEWAHLAGYADESEASFIAWLSCVRGAPHAQYSGWLFAYQHVASTLPRGERAKLARMLNPMTAEHLEQSAGRLERASPAVRDVARDAYDSYLKANRVGRGIDSYGEVVRFMLATDFGPQWTPKLNGARP
jgi:hypothetical protein